MFQSQSFNLKVYKFCEVLLVRTDFTPMKTFNLFQLEKPQVPKIMLV